MTIAKQELLINDEIREKEVRVIDSDGAQLGIISLKDALAKFNRHRVGTVAADIIRPVLIGQGYNPSPDFVGSSLYTREPEKTA